MYLRILACFTEQHGYGSIFQQLIDMGRVVVPGEDNADSLFDALAYQHHGSRITARHLRKLLCNLSPESVQSFLSNYPSESPGKVLDDLYWLLKGGWRADLKDLVLTSYSLSHNRNVVVIHNHSKPQMFLPYDDFEIDEDTIVIVEGHSECWGSRFHPTKITTRSDGAVGR